MILDFFFNLVNQKKHRLHFNEFMLNFHDFVHNNKDGNEENIIGVFVKDLMVIEKYSQKREGFVPRLSIIDVMMWNSKDAIKAHVNKATKLSAGAEFKGV